MAFHVTSLQFSFQKHWPQADLHAEGELQFSDGAWVHAVMGDSGVGKSTWARWLTGLVAAPGRLQLNELLWQDSKLKVFVKSQLRGVGFVAQGDRLFPHLSVAKNIMFGLRTWPRAKREARLAEMLHLTGLVTLAERAPHTLSGGERRRAALAQVLAIAPRLLILDEPFSGLDFVAKQKLAGDLKSWIECFCLPTILITHDISEAQKLASHIHNFQHLQEGSYAQSSPHSSVNWLEPERTRK